MSQWWQDKQNVNGHLSTDPVVGPAQAVGADSTGFLKPLIGLNPIKLYAMPGGDDGNDGPSPRSTAKKTGYAAYQLIQAAGSGTLIMGHNTAWGGPIPGQGCWLRADGKAIPGWLQAVPSVIEIEGLGGLSDGFALPQGHMMGGSNTPSDYRTKPSVWMCCNDGEIVEFRNMRPVAAAGHGGDAGAAGLTPQEASYRPWRIGWDYNRNSGDGSIAYLTVTSSTRVAGVTTHTVTLPSPGVAVSAATRVSNLVTFTIPRPAGLASFPPWQNGVPIWFESSDPANFPSGAFVVQNAAAVVDVTTDWSFSIPQAGADHVTPNAGFIRSLMCQPGDFIDLESTNAQFPSTQYTVQSCSVTNSTTGTITYTDLWSGHNGINANEGPDASIGQIAHQERGFGEVLNPRFINCGNYVSNAGESQVLYQQGPLWDIGAINAIAAYWSNCWFQGYYPAPGSPNPYDNNRMPAIVAKAGQTIGVPDLWLDLCTGTQVSLRYLAGLVTAFLYVDWQLDSSNGFPPPHVDMDASVDLTFNISPRTFVADAAGGFGTPVIRGSYDPLKFSGPGIPVPCVGPAANAIGGGQEWSGGEIPSTPWATGQIATFGTDLKTTGRHASAWRDMGLVGQRFINMMPSSAGWTVTGGSIVSSGVTSWNGLPNAIQTSPGFTATLGTLPSDTVNTYTVGGRWVFCGWINYTDPTYLGSSPMFTWTGTPGQITWKSSGLSNWAFNATTKYLGWQFVIAYDVVATVSNPHPFFSWGFSGAPAGAVTGIQIDDTSLCGFYVPSSVTDNDFFEFLGTLRSPNNYQAQGTVGTAFGQKAILHGGLGVDASVLATPSGTASPTKNMPLLKADGTIQGYIPVIPTNGALPAGTVTGVSHTAPITDSGTATNPNIGIADFVASGASHARGAVPDPGGSAGTAKYLREDATWVAPPGTTGDHKVAVDAGDANPDYLFNKVESTSGNISVTDVSGGGGKLLNLNGLPVRELDYFVSIPSLQAVNTANQQIATSNATPYSSGVTTDPIEYPNADFIAVHVYLEINLIASIGSASSVDIWVTRNGTKIVATDINVTPGTTGLGLITVGPISTGSASTGDFYGLQQVYNGNPVTGPFGAQVAYTARIRLTAY